MKTASMVVFLVHAVSLQVHAEVDVCATAPDGVVHDQGQPWTRAASPYRVRCDLRVAQLTIEPGVKVVFEGDYVLEVTGKLTARGTREAPIVFTSVDPEKVRWKGMLFNHTAPGSELVHCIVEYANDSGIRLIQSIQTIEECIVRKNKIAAAVGEFRIGGGMRIELDEGRLELKDCRFEENSVLACAAYGGGVSVRAGDQATVVLKRCYVTSNRCSSSGVTCGADSLGGGAYVRGSLGLENCVVRGNVVDSWGAAGSEGGGIYLRDGSVELETSVIAENGGKNNPLGEPRGAGLHVSSGGVATIRNCTFWRNTLAGIENRGGSVMAVNSILFFNNRSREQVMGNVTTTYSDVQNGHPGVGNISFNPGLISDTNLRIAAGSPCIDSGDTDAGSNDGCQPPGLGQPRNDMGAHGGPGNCCWKGVPWDCNENMVVDNLDIASGKSFDCDGSGIPDECEIRDGKDGAVDANRDGILDSCFDRACQLVPKDRDSTPDLTYTVKVTSNVPFVGGELALGLDPRILRVVAFRSLFGPTGFPVGTEIITQPPEPASDALLACTEDSIAGFTVVWHNVTGPLPEGTYELFELVLGVQPNSPIVKSTSVDFVYCLGEAGALVHNVISSQAGHSLPLFPFGHEPPLEFFVRGDVNGDDRHDVTDAVVVLSCLFLGKHCPACADAADSDDSGAIQLTDAVYLLNWRFRGGPEPPAPFPACGRDTTFDSLAPCVEGGCP